MSYDYEMNDDEFDDDAVSTDSMAKCPMEGSDRYRLVYRNIVSAIFDVRNKKEADRGMNFDSFRARVESIERSSEWKQGVPQQQSDEDRETDRYSLFLHVICNQFADSIGLNGSPPWEARPDMVGYYTSKRLRRRQQQGAPQEPPQHQHEHDPPPPPKRRSFQQLSESEYNDVSRALTVHDICKIRGVHQVPGLLARVDELVSVKYRNKYGKIPARNNRGLNVFGEADVPVVIEVIKDVALEIVAAKLSVDDPQFSGRQIPYARPSQPPPPPPPQQQRQQQYQYHQQQAPPPPQQQQRQQQQQPGAKHNFYEPSEEDLMPHEPEDKRVYWRDVLKVAGVDTHLAFTPAGEKFMRTRSGTNSSGDFVMEISKECGRIHVQRFGGPVPNADRNRIYTVMNLKTMFSAVNDVMYNLGFRS